MPELIRYKGSYGRSALYVDGKLTIYAGLGAVEEVLAEIQAEHPDEVLQVRVVESDDHLRGENQSDNIAMTIAEIEEYRAQHGAGEPTDREEPGATKVTAPAADLVRYGVDTGSVNALYVDGALDLVGDFTEIAERAMEIAGVRHVASDDFIRGSHHVTTTAQTLVEVAEFRRCREAARASLTSEQLRFAERAVQLARADELRAHAADLLRQADTLTEEATSA